MAQLGVGVQEVPVGCNLTPSTPAVLCVWLGAVLVPPSHEHPTRLHSGEPSEGHPECLEHR